MSFKNITHTENEFAEVPEIIRRFRKNYEHQNDKILVKLYFELLNKIQEDSKLKNFDSMIANAQLSLGLLEALIRDCKNSYGKFDIKTIPAIDFVLPHLAIRGNIGQIKNIQDIVNFFPELNNWKDTVEKAFLMQKLASKIYAYLKDNPDTLQKDLKKHINCPDGISIIEIINIMILYNKITRNKIGKFVTLSISNNL